MKLTLVLTLVGMLLCAIASLGCNKEPEVGYGGEVQTAPGGKALPAGKSAPAPSTD